jgi:hypothetical protein
MQNVIEGFKDKDKQANVATSEFVMKQWKSSQSLA